VIRIARILQDCPGRDKPPGLRASACSGAGAFKLNKDHPQGRTAAALLFIATAIVQRGHWEASVPAQVRSGSIRPAAPGRLRAPESHLPPGLAHGASEAAHFPQSEQQTPRQRGGGRVLPARWWWCLLASGLF
jgi:hypothetical protein